MSTFRLDDYEVTVGRFRKFVAEYPGSKPTTGAGKNPSDPEDQGWDEAWNALLPADQDALIDAIQCGNEYHIQTWTEDEAAGNENRPINCLTWFESLAFCIWDEGRLPTEAEWNYAAAGGDEQRFYPWSSPPDDTTIDETYASYLVDYDVECYGDGVAGCSISDYITVGSKPKGKGRFGQSDLSGNVLERVLDWYDPIYVVPCNDCANHTPSDYRVSRAGGLDDSAYYQNTTYRGYGHPYLYRVGRIGMRCARAP